MFILQVLGVCVLLTVMFGGTFLAWKKQWLNLDRHPDPPKWRGIMGLATVLGCTMQLFFLLLFQLSNYLSSSFTQRLGHFRVWGRVDSGIFLVTLLAAVFGKGQHRMAALGSAIATEIAWFLIGMGI
jgi:hypothetical protein